MNGECIQYIQNNFISLTFLLNIEYQELGQWIFYIGWNQNFGIFTFNPLDFLFKKLEILNKFNIIMFYIFHAFNH
jgi:hypothetical protein